MQLVCSSLGIHFSCLSSIRFVVIVINHFSISGPQIIIRAIIRAGIPLSARGAAGRGSKVPSELFLRFHVPGSSHRARA
jgi:hypothetical protein